MLRLVVRSWAFQVKSLSSSANFVFFSSIISPVLWATTAFTMLHGTDMRGGLMFAAIGAGMMGVWYTTLVASGQALMRLRQEGLLELLVAAPVRFIFVLGPITLATATAGLYSLVASVAWGWLLYGIPLRVAQPLVLVAAVPATVVSLGTLGMVFASLFVLMRHANALTNLLAYPTWLASGFLLPLGLLPRWAQGLSWFLPSRWGTQAVRDAVIGGRPWPAIGACVLLAAVYLGVALMTLHLFELLARRRATLVLA
jgi:ABC-2 type transport system permease protein